MSLRQRSTIFVIVLIGVLTAILAYTFYWLNNQNSEQAEQLIMQKYLSQVGYFLSNEANNLGIIANDWSNHPETASFLARQNAPYISANLSEQNLSKLKISSVSFFDNSLKSVYSTAKASDNVPPSAYKTIADLYKDNLNSLNNVSFSGLEHFEDKAFFFSLAPVYNRPDTTLEGYLLLTRELNNDIAEQASIAIGAEVTLSYLDIEKSNVAENGDSTVITVPGPNLLAFRVLETASGDPFMLASITKTRPVFLDTGSTLRAILIAGLTLLAITGISVLFYIEQEYIGKIKELQEYIRTVPEGSAHPPSPPAMNAEFERIATAFVNISAKLAQQELEKTKNQEELQTLRDKAANADTELAKVNAELTKLNNITLGRELKMVELKQSLEELKHSYGRVEPTLDDSIIS